MSANNPSAITPRRGVILPFVLVILCVLGVLVLAFSNMASQSQREAFRSGQDEFAKRIVEAALDEAFIQMNDETSRSGTAEAKWLCDLTDNKAIEKNLTNLPNVKIMADELDQLGPTKVSSLKVLFSKRKDDFRGLRQNQGVTIPYYGREGHGTLVVRGTVQISKGGKAVNAYTLERHHDYKVINLVSARGGANRNLAQNRNLDYALFVREGLDEFRATKGRMLNNANVRFLVKANGVGKICFGGADDKDNFVFLNLSPETASLLPGSDQASKPLDSGEKEKLVDDIVDQSPEAQQGLKEKMGILSGTVDDAKSIAKTEVVGTNDVSLDSKGSVFNPSPDPIEKDARDALFDKNLAKPDDNMEPGINILGHGDSASSVIEGHVRQRHLILVESKKISELLGKLGLNTPPTSITVEGYRRQCQNRGKTPSRLVELVYAFIEKLTPGPLKTTTSKYDDTIQYGGGEGQRQREYSQRRLDVGYKPYNFLNLRSFSAGNMTEFANLGFLLGNTLKMRGAVHCRAPIILGEAGALTVEGEGVISSNHDIMIKAGINSPGSSLLIINTQGNVIIDTSEKIEAAIAAQQIIINPGKTLNFKGSLLVRQLGSADWPAGNHVIEYDSTKFNRTDDVYSVTISPKISFIRMTGQES
jgi:hypothetical protein